MFLMLTGARRNEGATLTWDRVNINDDDPTDCWWHIPDPKNRNPVWLPLSSQAVALIKSRKPVKDNPHVFASRSKQGHIKDTRAPLEQLSRKIGMERLSAHDLRRTFVITGVKACRLDLAKLELLTNHVPQGITARHYLSTSDLRDFQAEVQAIGDYIEAEAAIAEAQATGANVVSLRA
jgi:integrase